ncbi:MAG TPA: tripartite tricarboxylate transporter substrate binding protein [Xanthobacteraceae bacterium]
MICRRIRTLALAIALSAVPGLSQSYAYPDRPVRIIVPYAPGGGNDTLARELGRKLEEIWGQPVVIENRAGANTIIATEHVSRLEPDGYNILMVTTIFSVNPSLVGKLPYDTLSDFAPVVVAGIAPGVLVARPALPVNSVKELIAYGRANPGKLTYGTPEIGTAPFLAAELLRSDGHFDAVNVSYRGTRQQMLALLSGEIDYAFDVVTSLEYVKSGKLKGLAVTVSRRLDKFPEIPTMIESGLPGYDVATWYGFVVRSRTPPDIINAINQAFNKAIDDPRVRAHMDDLGIKLLGGTPDQFGQRIRSEIERWGSVLNMAGIKLDDRR